MVDGQDVSFMGILAQVLINLICSRQIDLEWNPCCPVAIISRSVGDRAIIENRILSGVGIPQRPLATLNGE